MTQHSDSAWSSPLHLVPKPGGGWQSCGDYTQLNACTVDNQYPLPHIQDFNSRLDGTTAFYVVDLVCGFQHIPVAPGDIPKTAIITPFGLFEYMHMPFGLKNEAQTFQQLMDTVLLDLNFVFCYLDDILVASSFEEEHCRHLQQLFATLSSYGLTVVSLRLTVRLSLSTGVNAFFGQSKLQ